MTSRYTVEEQPQGFIVRRHHHTGNGVAYVTLRDQQWSIGPSPDLAYYVYEMLFYRGLLDAIAGTIMGKYAPLRADDPPFWLRSYFHNRCALALSKRVYTQWLRILGDVDDTLLTLHKKAFAAIHTSGPCLARDMLPKLAGHKYIISDLTNYRAAWHALMECRQWNVINEMENWRGKFSPTLEPYRTLNKTLMNLPAAVPHDLVVRLADDWLERPLVDRSEFLAVMIWRAIFQNYGEHERRHERVMWRSNRDDIRRAMRKFSDYQHETMSVRKTVHIHRMVQFSLDYPEQHNGTISGLVDKSIDWHRDLEQQTLQRQLEIIGPNKPTAKPPIPLPVDNRIRFLDTVENVVMEGHEMGHCISIYADAAVRGRCYLFHIDYNGERASIEVSNGQVAQAYGPRNSHNSAVRWGSRVLKKWAEQLPTYQLPTASGNGADWIPF